MLKRLNHGDAVVAGEIVDLAQERPAPGAVDHHVDVAAEPRLGRAENAESNPPSAEMPPQPGGQRVAIGEGAIGRGRRVAFARGGAGGAHRRP